MSKAYLFGPGPVNMNCTAAQPSSTIFLPMSSTSGKMNFGYFAFVAIGSLCSARRIHFGSACNSANVLSAQLGFAVARTLKYSGCNLHDQGHPLDRAEKTRALEHVFHFTRASLARVGRGRLTGLRRQKWSELTCTVGEFLG